MKFLFTSVFFGSLLILWGLSLVIEAVFGISFPIIKIAFALLLIYAGIMVIQGLYPNDNQKTIFFAREKVSSLKEDYKVVLGEGTIDLSSVQPAPEPLHIKVYTLLGKTVIKLNPNVPTIVHSTSIVSAVHFPDRTMISFGKYSFENNPNKLTPQVIIDTTTVLGALEVKNS